jgi:hypothetical protein
MSVAGLNAKRIYLAVAEFEKNLRGRPDFSVGSRNFNPNFTVTGVL